MRLSACLLLALLIAACDDESPSTGMDPEPDVAIHPIVDATPPVTDGGADAVVPPAPETCNGVDDDQDGQTDEGFAGLGDRCQATDGMCTSTGRQICTEDGTGVVCDAPPPAPSEELCDGKDNDCDGNFDEGIDLAVDPRNCARCGNVCAFDHANPACDEAVCIFTSCEAGFGDANGLLADGCECPVTNGGVEACDDADNDCDGLVDEGLAWTTRASSRRTGAGSRASWAADPWARRSACTPP
ncbi:MAG: MopE-related protein [bacterium]